MTTAAPTPADDDPHARARAIVAAADTLLAEGGVEALTVRAVLQRTGLARRAFYECFAGKDDLLLAVFERTIRLAADHYRAMLASVPDPLARVERIVTHLATGGDPHEQAAGRHRGAAMSREHLRLGEQRPAELQAALAPLIELLAELLDAGMAAGVVRRAPAQHMAMLVYNLVATTAQTEYLAQDPPDRERRDALAAELWEFCRRGIAA